MNDLFGDPERDEKGRFSFGNRFWRMNENGTRKRTYQTEKEIVDAAAGYFDWVADNPLSEEKVFGTGARMQVARARPMSIDALSTHLGITKQTWFNYAKNDELSDACARVQQVIDAWNFDLAATGLANGNIMARRLGLYDRMLHGDDPENPLPKNSVIVTYELPDNGRD